MKSLNLLKTLIDLFLFFSVLGALAVIIAIPVKLINPDLKIPVTIKGVEVSGSDMPSVLVIVMAAIGTFLFIYAIFTLRKILQLFSKKEIFTLAVVRNFKLIGKCLIAAALLTSVPMFFYNMIENNNLSVAFGGSGFDSLLLLVSLGLLFIVIGEIFHFAMTIKEENELTV